MKPDVAHGLIHSVETLFHIHGAGPPAVLRMVLRMFFRAVLRTALRTVLLTGLSARFRERFRARVCARCCPPLSTLLVRCHLGRHGVVLGLAVGWLWASCGAAVEATGLMWGCCESTGCFNRFTSSGENCICTPIGI